MKLSLILQSLIVVTVLFHVSVAQDVQVVDLLDVVEKKTNHQPDLVATIQLDEGLSRNENLVWQIYALKRREFLKDIYPETEGLVIPSFAEEVFARKEWAEQLAKFTKQTGKKLGEYFDTLNKVAESDLIREYVWAFHRQKNWTKPVDLDLEKFESWKNENLKSHEPQTKAKLVMIKPPKSTGIRILLDKNSIKNETDGAIWLHLAIQRFDYNRKNKVKPTVKVNDLIVPTFEEEVYARTHFAKDSVKHLKGGPSKLVRNYVQELDLVHKEGWMNEYVWTHYRQKSWGLPEGLRLEEYNDWAKQKIKNHKPIIGIALTGT